MKQLSIFNIFKREPRGKCHWKLFIDGASRNNPGLSGAGFFLLKDGEPIDKQGFFLGVRTNNQAEYLALLLGLFFLRQHTVHPEDDTHIISDSQLLVRQLKGEYKVKNLGLKPLFELARSMVKNVNGCLIHVLRTENTVADSMANVGIDNKVAVPQEFVAMLSRHGIEL